MAQEQPRDDHGRFAETEGGGSAGSKETLKAWAKSGTPYKPIQPVSPEAHQWMQRQAEGGHGAPVEAAVKFRGDVFHAIKVGPVPGQQGGRVPVLITKNGKPVGMDGTMNASGIVNRVPLESTSRGTEAAVLSKLDAAMKHNELREDKGKAPKEGHSHEDVAKLQRAFSADERAEKAKERAKLEKKGLALWASKKAATDPETGKKKFEKVDFDKAALGHPLDANSRKDFEKLAVRGFEKPTKEVSVSFRGDQYHVLSTSHPDRSRGEARLVKNGSVIAAMKTGIHGTDVGALLAKAGSELHKSPGTRKAIASRFEAAIN